MIQAQRNPVPDIQKIFEGYRPGSSFMQLLPKALTLLPDGCTFESNVWNLLPWMKRKGNSRVFNVDFMEINNRRLRELTKIYLLHKRLTDNIGEKVAYCTVYTIKALDRIVLQKDPTDLKTVDFYRTEDYLKENYESAARLCHNLLNFGEWLSARIGIPINYIPTVKAKYKYGRKGPEEGRSRKLLDTAIIRDMIECNAREDLSEKDRFFLSAFTILTATGFRINELATLPKNSFEEINGNYCFRYYPEKVRRLEVRYISSEMVPAVQAAVNHIIRITEPGREAVQLLRIKATLDWPAIFQYAEATRYFVGKFAHEWTSNQQHKLINPDGAWLNKEQRYVDVLSLVKSEGSKSAAARKMGVTRATMDGLVIAQQNARLGLLPNIVATRGAETRSKWDTDSRVISMLKFTDYCGVQTRGEIRSNCQAVISEAMAFQLEGKEYPCPEHDTALEDKYNRSICPVVIDGNGKAVLEPEDALFVVPKYFFSENRTTRSDDYRLITDHTISRWFNGEIRSRGTNNHEDSCFVRLGIYDPQTGEHAKFTSHDIRHWLDTTYAEGHMDEETIGLVFSRKKKSNHVYDQTSKKKRMENIRQAIRDGKAMGYLSENYNRLTKYSREDAEKYLVANTLMANLMPHGVCTLSWGMQSCPNYLSCFACESGTGLCSHFHINCSDESQVREVKRIENELSITLTKIPVESPQYEHLKKIKNNIEGMFAGKGGESNGTC